MVEFFGITEIQCDDNRTLTEFYFQTLMTRKALILSLKPFPSANFISFLEKNGFSAIERQETIKNIAIFTFQESEKLQNFIFDELEFIIRKMEISLIILHEIDFIFLEKPGISQNNLQSMMSKLKEINQNIDILVKFIKKRASQFLSLKMEYFIDWRYLLEKKEGDIILTDLTLSGTKKQ